MPTAHAPVNAENMFDSQPVLLRHCWFSRTTVGDQTAWIIHRHQKIGAGNRITVAWNDVTRRAVVKLRGLTPDSPTTSIYERN